MRRAEADRRVHDWEADVATLLLVDPIINSRRERILRNGDDTDRNASGREEGR